MDSIQDDIDELRRQLGKGSIQKAYRAIIHFMLRLRTHFANRYGDHDVSTLYQ